MGAYVSGQLRCESVKLVKDMKVTKIYHPRKERKTERGILRVAAYCRVSSNSEDQLNSYETQKAVYMDLINSHEDWENAGIYADRGITGTSAKKRPQFQQMIRDCEDGRIDCVICKSLSRFARNTKDAIFYIRKLQELGVRLIIEKEDIDTEDSFSEMAITILAAFAEEESRSISENLKWAKRKKAQAGEVILPRVYGYQKVGDNYEVVPEEAETVRMIFDLYEKGASSVQIVQKLSEMAIPTYKGKDRWSDSVICDVIRSEKYIGDYRTQKYYSSDITDEKRFHKNNGELPYVYIENHHEAIISREQFERCGRILAYKNISSPIRCPFGDRLRCPYCGHVLYYRSRKPFIRYFYCDGEDGETACRKFMVHSDLVKDAVLNAYNHLDLEAIQTGSGTGKPDEAEVEKIKRIKEEHPVFEKVDYWWLDNLVKEIQFGQHSFPETMDKSTEADDRTIRIFWKCGLTSTLPSGIKGDPRNKADELFIRLGKCTGTEKQQEDSTI